MAAPVAAGTAYFAVQPTSIRRTWHSLCRLGTFYLARGVSLSACRPGNRAADTPVALATVALARVASAIGMVRLPMDRILLVPLHRTAQLDPLPPRTSPLQLVVRIHNRHVT